MSSISNILNQFPDFQHLSSNTPFAVRTQQFQAQAQTSTTTNFSFTTAEGDHVSLSSGSESQFSFESYNFQGLAEGQAVDFRSQQLSTSTRSDFSLLIEGDLNEQELADIQAFIQSSKSILQDIVTGNVENATETGLSLSELDSLSSASLFFERTTAVSLAFRSTELAVQEDAQGNASRRREPNEGRGRGHHLEDFLDKVHKAQEQFQIKPEKLAQRLPGFLTKLVETLEKPFSKEDSPDSIFEKIRKEFFSSLLEATHNLKTDEETPEELAVEADKLDPATPALPPTVQNGDILANLLDESEVS
jgi:hypothetical protein